MSYMHIPNLYKDPTILLFRDCVAMEKVHGTSAHVSWNLGDVGFFAGGANHATFVSLFNEENLSCGFSKLGHDHVIVYGEAYGGKLQGMSHTYGPDMRFIAFEVRVGDKWLNVDVADIVCADLGLEFVPYDLIPCDIEHLDEARDWPSEVAIRRGITEPKPREGIVVRPPIEFTRNNGERVIAKHKNDAFSETSSPRKVGDPLVVTAAESAAMEWVTDERLRHVLDSLGNPDDMSATPTVMASLVADVMREGNGEIEDTKETRKAIGRRAIGLWKAHVKSAQVATLNS